MPYCLGLKDILLLYVLASLYVRTNDSRRGLSPALYQKDFEYMVNDRERNEANDAAVYARKGEEIARTCIPEDTAEYVILAAYPGADDFEVLGVGTKKFGLELGLKMDCNVNILFV